MYSEVKDISEVEIEPSVSDSKVITVESPSPSKASGIRISNIFS
jgi:hypothetical protein